MNQAKAEKKNKHNKTIITRIWVGAAAAIAAFVILPNTSPSVAYAMEQIPLLGNLIEVVTFRDYQYSSDRNNADVNVPKLVPKLSLPLKNNGRPGWGKFKEINR